MITLLNVDITMQLAVDMVIDPDSIDTTVDDIGGLDHILERLVRSLRQTPQ